MTLPVDNNLIETGLTSPTPRTGSWPTRRWPGSRCLSGRPPSCITSPPGRSVRSSPRSAAGSVSSSLDVIDGGLLPQLHRATVDVPGPVHDDAARGSADETVERCHLLAATGDGNVGDAWHVEPRLGSGRGCRGGGAAQRWRSHHRRHHLSAGRAPVDVGQRPPITGCHGRRSPSRGTSGTTPATASPKRSSTTKPGRQRSKGPR
jgi:hypothetical protein